MDTATQERMTGVVIVVRPEKGFAFVRTPGVARDHFFNIQDFQNAKLGSYPSVSFIHQSDPTQPRDRALDVRVIAAPEVNG